MVNRLIVLFAILLLAAPAHADTMYSYVGAPYTWLTPRDASGPLPSPYTTDMYLSGYFVVANPIANDFLGYRFAPAEVVLDWRFADGVQTFTPGNSTISVRAATGTIPGVERQGPFFDWDVRGTRLDGLGFFGSEMDLTASDFVGLGVFGSGNFSAMVTYFRFTDPQPPPSRMPMWTVSEVSVPERAILPRLPKILPRLYGWGVEAKITHGLQRATTWLAASMLRVQHQGTELYLPSVTVKVIEDCAGYQTLGLLLGVAGFIAAVRPRRTLSGLLLLLVVGAAGALLANTLRVVGIALGYEYLGALSQAAKDWVQYGTTTLGIGQLIAVGRLVGRSPLAD